MNDTGPSSHSAAPSTFLPFPIARCCPPPPPPFVRIYAGNGRQSYTGNYLYFIHVAFAILQKHINKKADIIAPARTTNADKYAQTRRQM